MWDYRNMTAQSTIMVRGPLNLIAVVVNTATAASVIATFDGNNLTTTNLRPIASIDASATGNFFYGCECRNGLTVTMSGSNSNVTVIFEPLEPYATDLVQ